MLPSQSSLETILPITQAVITSLNPDDVLQTLVQKIRELEGVKASAVFEYDEKCCCLRVRTSCGLSRSYARSIVVPLGSLAVGRAFESGQVEVVGHIDSDPSFARYLRRMHKEEFVAVVAAPLIARQKLLGILAIYFIESFNPPEREKDVMRTLGRLAAVALDNAKLFQAQLHTTQELEVLSKRLSDQSKRLSRSLRVHEWLVHTVLVHDGLDAVTGALAELAGAPVVVEDVHLNVIGFALPKAFCTDSSWHPEQMGLAGFADDARIRDHLARVRTQRRSHLLAAIPDIGLTTARISAPVFLGEKLLALVSLLSSKGGFPQEDCVLAEQGALAVALELMKAKVAFEAEQRIRGSFLQSLLSGEIDNLDGGYAAVAASKLDLTALQWVLAVSLDTPVVVELGDKRQEGQITLHSQIYSIVEKVILASDPKSMVVATKEGFTVLLAADRRLDEPAVRALGERVVSTVAESLAPMTVSVGIGGMCRDLRDVRSSFNEATRALEMAALLRKRGSVISFSDLGIFSVLLRQGKPDELREFADRYVAPLALYDQRHGGGLLRTLETYLHRNYSLTDTAQELFLHPNTVKYRLQKIEDICGVDLRSSEDLMNLQVAFRLHKFIA